MGRPLLTLAASLALSAVPALASPAQDLFDQVNTLIQTRYGGLSTVDRAQLQRDFQARLTAACQTAADGADKVPLDSCTRDTAYPVLEAEVDGLKDMHSFFERPSEFQDFVTSATGGDRLQFGVRLGKLDGDSRVVLEVVPGSAASDAGLKRGDLLLTINGQPYTYAGLQKARTDGAPTTLAGTRGGQPFSTLITARKSSSRDLPTLRMVGTVAVIRIPTFLTGGGVADRVHQLVAQAQRDRASGVVVDLRGDPGGSLSECDGAVSAFVPSFTRVSRTSRGENRTVVSRGQRSDNGRVYAITAAPALWTGPVSVLVDGGSASCSEFFTYELQYAGRATVVGTPTAGVGNTATQVFPLDDAGLQLTVINYSKPDGTPYPTRITPNVTAQDDILKLTQGDDVLLDAGIKALSGQQPAASVGASTDDSAPGDGSNTDTASPSDRR